MVYTRKQVTKVLYQCGYREEHIKSTHEGIVVYAGEHAEFLSDGFRIMRNVYAYPDNKTGTVTIPLNSSGHTLRTTIRES